MAGEIADRYRELIDGSTGTRAGRMALELAAENGAFENPESLRREFHRQLIDICGAYDSMDHRVSGGAGGIIQDDCLAVRKALKGFPEDS